MLDFLSVDVAYFEELSSDVKNALLDWVKEGGTIVFEGSGGWTALQKNEYKRIWQLQNF